MSGTAINARLLLTVCLTVVVLGCSGQQGPPRYTISGKVTYDGQPVQEGKIVFTPSSGPGSVADIVSGRYSTRADKGAVTGSQQVTICGTDGTQATATHDNTLFENYTTTIDVPEGDATFDFDIPAQPQGGKR